MKKWFIVLFLFLTVNAYSQIYMKKDAAGDVVYSDMPMEDAKQIDLPAESPPTPVITPEKATTETKPAEETKKPYLAFRIVSPVDQENIQNQPTLIVNMKTEPDLQVTEGDKIQVYVDGQKAGAPQNKTTIDVGRVDRGTHELYAVIVDKAQRLLKQSNVITIHIHQAHVGPPPVPQQPGAVRAPPR